MGKTKRAFLGGLLAFFLVQAGARAETVNFSWNKNPEPDIAGYRLYFGTTSGVYSQHIEVDAQTTTASLDLFVGADIGGDNEMK